MELSLSYGYALRALKRWGRKVLVLHYNISLWYAIMSLLPSDMIITTSSVASYGYPEKPNKPAPAVFALETVAG